jgi:hypothetical protein
VLVRAPGGQWSMAPVSTVADRLDDPSLLVDEATWTLRVFATLDGTVVTKTAPLDAISFAPGSGEPFVNGTGRTLSDPTVPKDPVDAGSGVVVLTSDPENRVYRHAELPLTPPTPVVDPTDHTPPTAPTGLQGRAVDPESVVLSWGAANDGTRWVPGGTGVPVAGYVVTRNGAEVATVTTTSFEDRVRAATDATAATSVRYSVVAVDAAGNRSAPATLVVAVPGSVRSLTPLYVAVALLALAVLIGIAYLLYRRRVVRGATIPELPEELSRDEPRTRTPVT